MRAFTNKKQRRIKKVKIKKLLSKIMAVVMLLSIIYVPSNAFASNDFSLTITEDAFGIKEDVDINIKNKVKGSKYTWITSNEKIATVDKVGVVKGLKTGDVIITCIITTPDGETHEFTSDIAINSKTKVTVVNQKQLEDALANDNVEQIIIKTSQEKEFKITEGNYDKRLYMKAPISKIVNEGGFRSVHSYVSNQDQLHKALADENVTIITIVTDEEENFELVGDYSRIRIIINAPSSTVLNNAILRGVDVKKVNDLEEKVYVPEVKEEEKIEEVVEEDVVTPPTGNSGGGGGGYFPPVNPNPQPSNPTPTPIPQPTEAELLAKAKIDAINSINAEAKKYDVSSKSDLEIKGFEDFIDVEIDKINKVSKLDAINNVLDTAISNIKGYRTPYEKELDQSKVDAITEINSIKDTYRSSLPTRLKEGFDTAVNDAINMIENALLIEVVNSTLTTIKDTMANYHIDNGNEAEMIASQKADYDLYKKGEMTLESLYEKYVYKEEGYSYTLPSDGVFFFEAASEFVYIDYEDNKTYTFIYDEAYYSTVGLDLVKFKEELLWGINNRNTPVVIDGEEVEDMIENVYTSKFNGFLVSFNSSTKTLAIADINTVNITFSQIMDSELTKWQNELGEWYYGYPSDISTLDWIRTDNGETKISTSTVSGSAITFDFKLYNNNTDGVKLVCFSGSQDELDVKYYDVNNHEDNTSTIIFNNDFVMDYIMTQTEDKKLMFNIFPDIYTYSNGTGITFDITVDHLKEK